MKKKKSSADADNEAAARKSRLPMIAVITAAAIIIVLAILIIIYFLGPKKAVKKYVKAGISKNGGKNYFSLILPDYVADQLHSDEKWDGMIERYNIDNADIRDYYKLKIKKIAAPYFLSSLYKYKNKKGDHKKQYAYIVVPPKQVIFVWAKKATIRISGIISNLHLLFFTKPTIHCINITSVKNNVFFC